MQSGGFESQTLLHSSSNRKGFYQCNLEGGVLSCRMEHIFQTVNLDFETEEDMKRKFQVGLALQPIATALFANSPFTDGKPNGYLSFRR
jgi:gamma-glutamylcysteine synthetase